MANKPLPDPNDSRITSLARRCRDNNWGNWDLSKAIDAEFGYVSPDWQDSVRAMIQEKISELP